MEKPKYLNIALIGISIIIPTLFLYKKYKNTTNQEHIESESEIEIIS